MIVSLLTNFVRWCDDQTHIFVMINELKKEFRGTSLYLPELSLVIEVIFSI